MSPDPYLGSISLTNPQSYNRYTYALNNPLMFVDPSGLVCVADPGTYDPLTYFYGDQGQYNNSGICQAAGGSWDTDNCDNPDCTVNISANPDPPPADTQSWNLDPGQLQLGGGFGLYSGGGSGDIPGGGGGAGVGGLGGTFTCASEAAGKVSIAGALQAAGVGKSGVSGFLVNALGGNAFSGASDLLQSLASGEGGGHDVFYNMALSVVAGPTQGFGAVLGDSTEGTPWGSGAADLATTAVSRFAYGVAATDYTAPGGAGASISRCWRSC